MSKMPSKLCLNGNFSEKYKTCPTDKVSYPGQVKCFNNLNNKILQRCTNVIENFRLFGCGSCQLYDLKFGSEPKNG